MNQNRRPTTTSPLAALLLSVAIGVPAAIAPSARAQDLPVEPRFAALDAWLEAFPQFFPEGVGVVLAEDGVVVFRRTYHGLEEDAILPIASSSKWISGLAVTAAIADPANGLSVDSPISEHVPVFGPPFAPDKVAITLGQAFRHTSGFASGSPNPHQEPLLTHQQAVTLIATLPLEGGVGEQVRYGGKAMSAAALAVARALATDWTTHASTTLFEPLGMTATDWDALTPPEAIPTANPNPAGSIRTTLQDYERFVVMLSRGGIGPDGTPVVTPAAIELLVRDQVDPALPVDVTPYEKYEPFVPGVEAFRPGFGCYLDPQRIVASTPPGVPGARWATSAGALGTTAFLDLDRRLAGVVFTRNFENWPNPDPDLPPYNPSLRAFLQYLRPLIEAAVPPVCPTDANRSGATGFGDLLLILGQWGGDGGPGGAADVTADGVVDFQDLVAALAAWGPCD